MSHRKIEYQAGDGKWYTLEVWDIFDPLDEHKLLISENNKLILALATAQATIAELQLDLKKHEEAVYKYEPLWKGAMQYNEELEAQLHALQWRKVSEESKTHDT